MNPTPLIGAECVRIARASRDSPLHDHLLRHESVLHFGIYTNEEMSDVVSKRIV